MKARISRLIENGSARYLTNHGVPYLTCPNCFATFLSDITCAQTEEGRLCPVCTAWKRQNDTDPIEAWRAAMDLIREGKRFVIVS